MIACRPAVRAERGRFDEAHCRAMSTLPGEPPACHDSAHSPHRTAAGGGVFLQINDACGRNWLRRPSATPSQRGNRDMTTNRAARRLAMPLAIAAALGGT